MNASLGRIMTKKIMTKKSRDSSDSSDSSNSSDSIKSSDRSVFFVILQKCAAKKFHKNISVAKYLWSKLLAARSSSRSRFIGLSFGRKTL